MKKVLSLVLALVMAFGMATVAFAAVATLGADVNVDLAAETFTIGTEYVLTVPVAANLTNGETLTYDTACTAKALFTKAPTAVVTTGGATASVITVKFTMKAGTAITAIPANTNIVFEDDATETLTVELAGAKIVNAAAPGKTNAPSGAKISGIDDDAWINLNKGIDWDAARGDTKAEFELTADMFLWDWTDGTTKYVKEQGLSTWTLRASQLSDIKLRITQQKGFSGVIKNLWIDGTTVKCELVKYYNKTGNTDFSFEVGLTFKGTKGGVTTPYSGTMKNEVVEIEKDQDSAYIDGNYHVKALDTVRGCEFEVGENCYVTKNLSKDQKAYCRASLDLSSADSELFLKYAEMDSVYTMVSTNMAGAGTTVRFDLADTFYVYDKDFKLLGTTADKKLPWSDKFYLTTKKVDLAGTPVVEEPTPAEPTTPAEPETPVTGGDAPAAPNANFNPNTGL